MKTNDLISLLSQDAPVRSRLGRRLTLALAAGLLISGGLFFSAIGFRSDVTSAIETVRFLFKLVVTIALAATASALLFRIGRPGLPLKGWAMALAAAPVLLACGVAVELMVLPEPVWQASMMGHNARFCLTLIPLLSLGPLACFLAGLRYGAPARPGLAGAVAGLAAAGIAATFYASNCIDDSPLFVALWYPIAIAMVALLGYAAGRRLLRW